MAKTPAPVIAQPADPCVAQTPTPENTPIPGGGRWRWDITAPGWVDVDAPAPDQPNPTQPE